MIIGICVSKDLNMHRLLSNLSLHNLQLEETGHSNTSHSLHGIQSSNNHLQLKETELSNISHSLCRTQYSNNHWGSLHHWPLWKQNSCQAWCQRRSATFTNRTAFQSFCNSYLWNKSNCFLSSRSFHRHIGDVRKELNYSNIDVNKFSETR